MSAENISYDLKRFAGIKRDYTEEEVGTWAYCYPKLKKLLVTNACDETN